MQKGKREKAHRPDHLTYRLRRTHVIMCQLYAKAPVCFSENVEAYQRGRFTVGRTYFNVAPPSTLLCSLRAALVR